jgi:hypothetical protein
MIKRFTPVTTKQNYITLQYSGPIYETASVDPVLTSTGFTIGGVTHYFKDVAGSNKFNRRVFLYNVLNGRDNLIREVGAVDCTNGTVTLGGFAPDTTAEISITVMPNSNDIAPKRNQILDISSANVTITGEIDSIAVSGSVGAINYTTFARHR